jgi:predicted nucleic acid-binding protein
MVIVDTDVIIASIRGNDIAKQVIGKYASSICISVITEMELHIEATNKAKKDIAEMVLKQHKVIHINKSICEIASRLIKTYNTRNGSLHLPDALIAATYLNEHCSLVTFNTKDFAIIKGLHLAK